MSKHDSAYEEAQRKRLEEERRKQEAEQREKERRERERNEFLKAKRNEFKKVLYDIEDLRADSGEFISTEEATYKRFVCCRDESLKEPDIRQIWVEEYNTFLKRLDSNIKNSISDIASHVSKYTTSVHIWSICREFENFKTCCKLRCI